MNGVKFNRFAERIVPGSGANEKLAPPAGSSLNFPFADESLGATQNFPERPVNSLCDLRLKTKARFSIDVKITAYAAEWQLRRGERTWRMKVPRPYPMVRESEELCTFQEL